MKMSEEMAVRLHRMMWSDMQKELGDTPDASDRNRFKEKWCETHFPGEYIHFNCFLCDYCGHDYSDNGCDKCPIEWPDGVCSRVFGQPPAKTDYRFAPISEILALPTRNKELADEKELNKNGSYYEFRENLLSEYSGLPANFAFAIADHVKAIKEKAVEEYFDKTPGAKLATMDMDQAFKQYADEQKAPIFKQLSNASGLSENNHAVLDHIIMIKKKAKQEGQDETKQQMKDLLAEQSGLNHNIPIGDHIHEIVKKLHGSWRCRGKRSYPGKDL